MQIITPEQWLHVDLSLPLFYNGSGDIISIRQEKNDVLENVMMAMPGHVVQLNAKQAFLTRISPEGDFDHFTLCTPEEMLYVGFDSNPLLSALRSELDEILINTNN